MREPFPLFVVSLLGFPRGVTFEVTIMRLSLSVNLGRYMSRPEIVRFSDGYAVQVGPLQVGMYVGYISDHSYDDCEECGGCEECGVQ